MESKSSKVLNPKAGKKVAVMSLQAKYAKAAFLNLEEGSKDGSISTEMMTNGGGKYSKEKPRSGEGYQLFNLGN